MFCVVSRYVKRYFVIFQVSETILIWDKKIGDMCEISKEKLLNEEGVMTSPAAEIGDIAIYLLLSTYQKVTE